MFTFVRRIFNNSRDRSSNTEPRSNTSPSIFNPPLSTHCNYDDDDIYYQNDLTRPCHERPVALYTGESTKRKGSQACHQGPLTMPSAFDEAETLSRNFRNSEASSISATKTSIIDVRHCKPPFADESAKENVGGSAPDVRLSPVLFRSSRASLYAPSPTSAVPGGIKTVTSSDVCCCVLCNKARQERRRACKGVESEAMQGKKTNKPRTSNSYRADQSRTLREISYKSNGCNNAYVDDDDDGGGDDDEDNNNINGNDRNGSGLSLQYTPPLSSGPDLSLQGQIEGTISRRPSSSTTTSYSSRTRSSTISLPKSETSDSSSMRNYRLKATTPPGDATTLKFDGAATTGWKPAAAAALRSVDCVWPQAPHSPLSFPDGEEGPERYRMRLEFLNSQAHLETYSPVVNPPNVTIRHVEEVRATDDTFFRDESFRTPAQFSPHSSRGSGNNGGTGYRF